MAKPSHVHERPRLLVTELWGLGDLALAVPFLRTASVHTEVTLLAKPSAAPLLARFAPGVALVPLVAPWTAFHGKYRLHAWPWRTLAHMVRQLRAHQFDIGVTARPDPRDHALLRFAGARQRIGYPRAGSSLLLNRALSQPAKPHRAEYWRGIAAALGWSLVENAPAHRTGQRVVIHTGAAQPTRCWPRDRFGQLIARLRAANWEVTVLDDAQRDLDALIAQLAAADRFIGNDSGPGHLAALLGVPTFTIFGPNFPDAIAPQHPRAAWIEGAPCPYKPCFDSCRFAEPHCIRSLTVDEVWKHLACWLA